MLVTLLGISMLTILPQSLNAPFAMEEPSVITTVLRLAGT